MEFDNEVMAEKCATSVNDLLEVSIQKLGRILKDILDEPSVTSEDKNDLLDVNSICYELACKVGGWHERKYPALVPWLPEDRSQMKDMTLLSCKSPWSIVLKYRHLNLDLLKDCKDELELHKFIETPPVGAFVCVMFHRKIFRALLFGILSYNRLKVLNIDTNEVFIVPASSIYHMPPHVCGIQALSVHCCMIEDDEVVEKLWSEDLEAVFTRTLEECSIRVEIVKSVCESPPKYLVELVGTNSEGHILNLTEWLNNVLIPDMKESIPLLAAKDELLYFLKDASIDPFGVDELGSTMSLCSKSKEQILSSLCNVPPPIEGPTSCANSTIALSVTNDEDDKEKLLFPSSKFGIHQDFSSDEPCRDFNCLKKPGSTNAHGNGFAPNIQRLKFSVSPVRNRITLPQVGDRVNVVISHILTPLSFYVALEEKYSDVVDHKGTETYTTLFNRMNLPLSNVKYRDFFNPPSIGQLVAFRGTSFSSWCRGIIMGICKCSAQVLNPDLGKTEVIPPSNLKTIAEEDTILPFQAVLTFLHNIRCTENNSVKAKDYFMQLISSKNLHVVVKSADVDRCVLEVELFTSQELSINEALVSSGFCVKIVPSPHSS